MKAPARKSGRPSALGLLCTLALSAALAAPARAQDSSDELGRLFFTPERRQQLDRQRQFNIQEKQEVAADPTLTINGVVTRSSGKRTVWINGVAQNDNEQASGTTVTPSRQTPGQVVVHPSDAPQSKAKVGDTVSRSTGETTDLLGDGRIHVGHAVVSPSTAP